MKKCSNPTCSYHTEFEDYLACPRCQSPLVDTRTLTGSLPPEALSEAQTSPYVPISRLQHDEDHEYGANWQYAQQSLPYPESAGGAYSLPAPSGDIDEPLRPLHSDPISRVRSLAIAAGAAALILVCLVLSLSLAGRFSPHPTLLNTTTLSATETASASLHPAINTPIPLLPTIPPSVANSAPPPAGQPQSQAPQSETNPSPTTGQIQNPKSKIQNIEALMSARLEGGKPAGPTSAYHPTDSFNLAVKADFGDGGVQTILTRWYGPDNAQIYEMKHAYSQQGTYYTGFTVTKNGPWAPGTYRADIYTNDSPQPTGSVTFQVIP